jgi:hypothetical protein
MATAATSTLSRLEREVAELAARVAMPATSSSPVGLADQLGLSLDPWQRAALTSSVSQCLWNVHRQGGKSTVAALLALHTALSQPGALVLVVSPTERQSKLLFQSVMRFYRALGKPVPALIENRLSVELMNASAIHALPGDADTIRGFAGVDLLLVDEAARVPDEMVAAVRPMLAVSGGRLVTMSTPNGQVGWWWLAWSEGGDDWERVEVPASSCPRISAAWLDQERRALPASWFAAEYENQFTDVEDAAFRGVDIDAAFSPDVRPLFAPVEISA